MAARAFSRGFLAVILALAVGTAFSPAMAQAFYTVEGVAVDITADTAAAAQQRALAEAQDLAYDRLIKRIVGPEHLARVPPADAAKLQSLVRGIEVEEEKRSSTRYIARLTVAFKPDAVRQHLRGANIPFNDARARPILIVPVYTVAGAVLLWDENNPWRDAWAAIDTRDKLQPILVPKGDLADLAALGAGQAAAGDPNGLAALARRHRVQDILVAHATLRIEAGSVQPVLDVALRRIGQGPDRLTRESFTGRDRDQVEPLLVNAAQVLAARMEADWRRDARLLQGGQTARLTVRVPVADIGEWVTVRDRLAQIPAVRSMDIGRLGTTGAQVTLHHYGEPRELAIALLRRDLELSEREGYWTLRYRPGAAASAPADE